MNYYVMFNSLYVNLIIFQYACIYFYVSLNLVQ